VELEHNVPEALGFVLKLSNSDCCLHVAIEYILSIVQKSVVDCSANATDSETCTFSYRMKFCHADRKFLSYLSYCCKFTVV